MSHPLRQLRGLLKDPSRVTGTIQKVAGATVYVATTRGIVMATAESTAGLRAGASVTLNGDRITSVRVSEGDLPLFSV